MDGGGGQIDPPLNYSDED